MNTPTIAHLRTIGIEVLQRCRVTWEPFGRRPWRIAYIDEDQCEAWLRWPPDPADVIKYEGRVGGNVCMFRTAKDASTFLRLCGEKLQRALDREEKRKVAS